MNKIALGLLGTLMMSAPLHAAEPFVIIDYTKIHARQYCVYNGQLYTRGIRIKTDTGTYTCPGMGDGAFQESRNLRDCRHAASRAS